MDVQTVETVMTKDVFTLSKTAKVSQAIKMMSNRTISCIVIVNKNKKPIGIITERDLVKRVLQMGINPHETEINYIMSSPVFTVSRNANIADVMTTMQEHNVRRVVVISDDKKLIGLITQTDLLNVFKSIVSGFVGQTKVKSN